MKALIVLSVGLSALSAQAAELDRSCSTVPFEWECLEVLQSDISALRSQDSVGVQVLLDKLFQCDVEHALGELHGSFFFFVPRDDEDLLTKLEQEVAIDIDYDNSSSFPYARLREKQIVVPEGFYVLIRNLIRARQVSWVLANAGQKSIYELFDSYMEFTTNAVKASQLAPIFEQNDSVVVSPEARGVLDYLFVSSTPRLMRVTMLWALAHEFGHFVYEKVYGGQQGLDAELFADEFAYDILSKRGWTCDGFGHTDVLQLYMRYESTYLDDPDNDPDAIGQCRLWRYFDRSAEVVEVVDYSGYKEWLEKLFPKRAANEEFTDLNYIGEGGELRRKAEELFDEDCAERLENYPDDFLKNRFAND